MERKVRKTKREKKKRKRRSPSTTSSTSGNEHTSDELSEGELRKKILKKREKVIGEHPDVLKPVVKPTLGKWEEKEDEASVLQNTTLKFGLESTEDIPKRVVRNTPPQFKKFIADGIFDGAEIRMSPPLASQRVMKGETVNDNFSSFPKKGMQDSAKKAEMASPFSSDIDSLLGKRMPSDELKPQTSMFGKSHTAMHSVLDATDDLQPNTGGLRLSSLTRQMNAETERERKLARLPPELVSKYVAKKKQFDVTFKADRETFGFVAKTLIQKDPGLEDRIRLALVEAFKDMEEGFTQKLDQYLDQLFMFVTV